MWNIIVYKVTRYNEYKATEQACTYMPDDSCKRVQHLVHVPNFMLHSQWFYANFYKKKKRVIEFHMSHSINFLLLIGAESVMNDNLMYLSSKFSNHITFYLHHLYAMTILKYTVLPLFFSWR